jgi:antitoxin component YwqK of YwqJK toxin-antitoxin module
MDEMQKQDGNVTGTAPVPTLNLWQRLNAIKKAVAYVKKDEKKVDGMYNAVTHDAVTAATRDAFIEHGVFVLPTELKSACVDSGMVTAKGNPIIRFEATYRITFINMDAPTERESTEITAHALDQGDKAPGKALSYATKAALLKALQIETGVNDEEREDSKPKKFAEIPIPKTTITPTTGTWEMMSEKQKSRLTDLAVIAKQALAAGDPAEALRIIDDAALETEEKVALTTRFDSKQRTAMRKAREDAQLGSQI